MDVDDWTWVIDNEKLQYKRALFIKKTVVKAGIRKRIMVISGGILTVLFATSVLMAILDSGNELRQNLIVYVALLIPSVLLLYKGMKDGALTDLANRYNSIFECDRDGVVTFSELTKQMGKATPKILSELERLLEKGYLCNCSLQKKLKNYPLENIFYTLYLLG